MAVLIVGALVLVALPFAANGLSADPAKTVVLSADDAKSRVTEFVNRSDWTTDLSVTGPTNGAFMRYYDVIGKSVIASVNAHDGSVTSLLLGEGRSFGVKATTTQADATATAERFLAERNIDVEGLDQTANLSEQGDTSSWAITWQGHAGVMLVPKSFEVDVDAASGLVFGFAAVNHAYVRPDDPKITQEAAENAAIEVSGLPDIESVQLQITVSEDGTQQLTYEVRLTGSVEGQPTSMRQFADVHVDAMTGEAKVVGVG
ncbi:MAG: hypothetical protein QFC55_05930 [Chloroflexota bacterium]|nr:hypothetical protein [Chloroflexota bacterium]